MALEAQIPRRIQWQIRFEIGAMKLMATGTGQLAAGTGIDDFVPDRVRSLMGVFVAIETQIDPLFFE